MNEFIMDILIL